MRKWTFWRYWRLWLSQILGLALFALAGAEGFDTHHPSAREEIIGIATKVITGVLAILLVRLPQDLMDRIDKLQARIRALEQQPGQRGRDTPS